MKQHDRSVNVPVTFTSGLGGTPNAPMSDRGEHAPQPKIVRDLLVTNLSDRIRLIREAGDAIEQVQA